MSTDRDHVGVLHLSDFHLTAGAGKASQKRVLTGLTAKVWELAQDQDVALDAILITGDLADTCRESDLKEVREFLCTPLGSDRTPWINGDRPSLQAASVRIGLIPGDCDRSDEENDILGDPCVYEVLEATGLFSKRPEDVYSFILPNEDNPLLGVVCADFTRNNGAGGNGEPRQGLASQARREALRKRTVRLQGRGIPVIWIMHFYPDPQPKDHTIKLIGAQEVLELARDLGVPRILCGHLHVRTTEDFLRSEVTVHCAGHAGIVPEPQLPTERAKTNPARIQLLTFRVDQQRVSVDLTSWWWSARRMKFVVEPPDGKVFICDPKHAGPCGYFRWLKAEIDARLP